MRILDATAGNRAVWFDKEYPDATFIDIREGLHPGNRIEDCRKTEWPDGWFDLVVFDPPHLNVGPTSRMADSYGHWTTEYIRKLVSEAFLEFHRILKPDGLVAFKWNDHDTSLEKVLAPVTGFDRLVGVPTAQRTKHASVTYWCLLRRRESDRQVRFEV